MLNNLVNSRSQYKYPMKKLIFFIRAFCLILLITGCSKCKAENYMNAVVKDITEESLDVSPIDNESVNSDKDIIDADSIIIDLNNISIGNLPQLNKGDRIRIVYNGESVKEDPMKIEIVFAIYLLDENGDVISN
ncbi:hypothetical protein [Clostridium sp. D46t1_190503_E9]|uniref:hypothetical protein n=1 Tax=Clostridium sp. D46t1_190503_E9 TaxID=2787137 RepID=UPI00189B4D6A|nr:hypothetical protein [Clostridium sp. D46t1_190503_E9]